MATRIKDVKRVYERYVRFLVMNGYSITDALYNRPPLRNIDTIEIMKYIKKEEMYSNDMTSEEWNEENEEFMVLLECETCNAKGWIESNDQNGNPEVQKCDECSLFETDADALNNAKKYLIDTNKQTNEKTQNKQSK